VGGDTGDIISAYLDLAGALEAAGMQRMAEPVYERVLELDPYNDAARTALGPGGAERKPAPAGAAEPERPSATPGRAEDSFVSLRELVVEEEPAAGSTRMVAAEKEPTGDEDQDFAELLSLFRSKVAQTLAGEDATAHFDLGLAYKEMGLYAEAVSEFQVVLRAGNAPLSIYEELGQCFVAMQRPGIAVKILEQGLRHPADDLDRIGMYYFLGRAWEDLGQREHARDAYERVIALDVGFADATSRVSGL
jgi:tetratricopeptide (TPR) repeat protein